MKLPADNKRVSRTMLQMVSMPAADVSTAAHSADLPDRVALHVLTANVHLPEATYMNVMHVIKMI